MLLLLFHLHKLVICSNQSTAESSTMSNQQQLRRPYQAQGLKIVPEDKDYAQMGIGVGLTMVCASVVAGTVAFARGNKAFYDKMFRLRMIIVVSGAAAALVEYRSSNNSTTVSSGRGWMMGKPHPAVTRFC